MAESPAGDRVQDYHTTRRSGLTEADLARADPHLREALITNKREGLLLAVRVGVASQARRSVSVARTCSPAARSARPAVNSERKPSGSRASS